MTDEKMNQITSADFTKQIGKLTDELARQQIKMLNDTKQQFNALVHKLDMLAEQSEIMYLLAKLLCENKLVDSRKLEMEYLSQERNYYPGHVFKAGLCTTYTGLKGLSFEKTSRIYTMTVNGIYEYTTDNLAERLVSYHTIFRNIHRDYDDFDLTSLKIIANVVAEGYDNISTLAQKCVQSFNKSTGDDDDELCF